VAGQERITRYKQLLWLEARSFKAAAKSAERGDDFPRENLFSGCEGDV
jgi:hypothetical protein